MDASERIEVTKLVDYVLQFAPPASPFNDLNTPIETMKVGSVGTNNALDLARAKRA
jgi:dTDP-glucose 4,6-dehydratase